MYRQAPATCHLSLNGVIAPIVSHTPAHQPNQTLMWTPMRRPHHKRLVATQQAIPDHARQALHEDEPGMWIVLDHPAHVRLFIPPDGTHAARAKPFDKSMTVNSWRTRFGLLRLIAISKK